MSAEVIGSGVCSSPDSPSDEKMDTCESLNSQHPSSPLSSPMTDCDERTDNRIPENTDNKECEVLRIANPISGDDNGTERMDNAGVLRLAQPQTQYANTESKMTDDLTTTMTSTVTDTSDHCLTNDVDSDNNHSDDLTKVGRNKIPASLTLTSNHPLMNLSSPESPEQKLINNISDENGLQRNGVVQSIPNKIMPDYSANSSSKELISDGRNFNPYQKAIDSWFPTDVSSIRSPSMSQSQDSLLPPSPDMLDNAWPCSTLVDEQSPYDGNGDLVNGPVLAISSTASLAGRNRRKIIPITTPDMIENYSPCSSPEEEPSLYQAMVDPFSGSAAMRPTERSPEPRAPRRKIVVGSIVPDSPTETESSIDSRIIDNVSVASVKSDDIYVNAVKRCIRGVTEGLSSGDFIREPPDDDCTDTDTENSRRDSQTRSDASEHIPEYSANEERRDSRDWVKVTLPGGGYKSIDMKVIEPYKRVLSHGGYTRSEELGVAPGAAIIVFSACYLPDSARVDYNYVMENLFLYVVWTLERLVTDEYVLVYLHGSASRCRMPTFHWLKKCYHLIDRRLRKSLKHLYLVHPTFWLKSIVWMSRPFISTKFSQKLSYINTLEELLYKVPVEPAAIPEKVRQYDDTRT